MNNKKRKMKTVLTFQQNQVLKQQNQVLKKTK